MDEQKKKGRAKRPKRKKNGAKRVVVTCLAAALVGGAAFGVYTLFFTEEEREAMTGKTTFGALDRSIQGSGTTVPAESLSITAASTAEIKEVYVKVGDMVNEGDLLYTQDDSEVDEKIESLEEQIVEKEDEIAENESTISDTYEKIAEYEENRAEAYETLNSLTVKAAFDGHIGSVNVEEGKTVNKGTVLATLTDTSAMELTQYFSYAYYDGVYVGMAAEVRVSGELYYLDGEVTDVSPVEWFSEEGMKCFAVTVAFKNPGSLTEKTTANAALIGGTDRLYAVKDGEIAYRNFESITAEASGEVTAVYVSDYDGVKAGQTLFVIDGESYTKEIESIEKQITSAEKQIETLEKKIKTAEEKIEELKEDIAEAEESRGDFARTSDISGKVMYVNVEAGDKPNTMSSIITIYNLEKMSISVNFDELDVDYISEGTEVIVTRTSAETVTPYNGVITYLSPEASSSSGVATFAATIEIDSNNELSSGVSVSYSISLGDSEEGVLAPVSALKSNDGQYYLYVQSDTAPEGAVELVDPETEIPKGFFAVPVEVGSSNSQYVRILSGVDADVTVFTRYRQTAPTGGNVTSTNGEEEFEFGSMEDMFGGNMPSFGGAGGTSGGMPSFGGTGGTGGSGGSMPGGFGGGRQ